MNIRQQMQKMGISESEIREWEGIVVRKKSRVYQSNERWRQNHPEQWARLRTAAERKANGRRSVRKYPRIAFDFFDRSGDVQ